MWTNSQISAFQRTLAAADKYLVAVEHLEEIAKHAPQFADRVRELRIRADMAKTLATVALSVINTSGR